MPYFEPAPDRPISSEMIRQGFAPSADEALEIIHLDEAASGADAAIALGTAAIGIACSAGILGLSGLTLPILLPLGALGFGAVTAWNSRVTQRKRASEAEFLEEHGGILDLAEQKLNQGQPAHKVAAAVEKALRAYNYGEAPTLSLGAASSPAAVQLPAVGAQTQLAIPVQALPVAGKTCGQCAHFSDFKDMKAEDRPNWEEIYGEGLVAGRPAYNGGCLLYMEPANSGSHIAEKCKGFTPGAIAAPETYPMANTEVSPDDRRALITRLREECPALLKLVKSHPIRAVGVQRSGKTTLVKRLALLRMVLIPGHRVIAATPHHEAKNPYPAKAFKVVGITNGQRDYAAIEREWDGLAARVAACQESSITTIWDEFGLFDQVMPTPEKGEDKLKSVLTSCMRETMKFGEFPVFVVHGETAAFLPGSKGLVTVFLGSTVRLEAIGEPVEDEMGLETIRPTGKFTVTWLDGSRDEGQVPAWLTEQYLLGLIGNSAPIPAAISYPPPPDYTNTQEQPKKPAVTAPPEPANDAPKLDIEKPDLPMKEIMLQCSMLAEWIEGKPGLSFAQKYANYNASRKGFTRPQFRYLLSQLGETDL